MIKKELLKLPTLSLIDSLPSLPHEPNLNGSIRQGIIEQNRPSVNSNASRRPDASGIFILAS